MRRLNFKTSHSLGSNFSNHIFREYVESIVAKHLPAVEQMHSTLYLHSAEKLILMENVTDAYRYKVTMMLFKEMNS